MARKKIDGVKLEEHAQRLRVLLPAGSTLFVTQRGRSRSGMRTYLDLWAPQPDRRVYGINHRVAALLGYAVRPDGVLVSSGCAYSHAEAICLALSKRLYGDVYAIALQEG